MDSFFTCAFCMQQNSVFVEPDGGEQQRYVEDCQVCCRPNQLFVYWDDDEEQYVIDSEPES